MTEPLQPFDLQYAPPSAGRVHLRVAGILNLVMCGLDFLYGFGFLTAAVVLALINPAPDPGAPPTWVISVVIGAVSVAALVAATLKLIAGVKMLKASPGCRGWAIAAGIVGCMQLWCSYMCVLPLAIGVYTIVVGSLSSVRNHLLEQGSPAA